MTRVLGIACSMRKDSNSEILLQRALASAKEAGAETELLRLLDASVAPCDGCYACSKAGVCHIEDDMQEWLVKVDQTDAVIFGTPVYFWTLAGQTKVLMDRLYPLYIEGKLANKVGAVIAVASSMGHTGVWQVFNNFFCASHMLAADFVYAYARERGDARRDKHAWHAAWELGKEVVALASSQFGYPAAYPKPIYNLVKDRYGVASSPASGRFGESSPVGDPARSRES